MTSDCNTSLTIHAAIAALPAMLLAGTASAADFPVRPIRLIVPQAAGSASDTVARLVAAELVRQMNQQIVIDNRPGGALMIGMELVAHAPPDGYTIGYGPIGALAIGPNMVKGLTFSVLKDLQPLAQTTTGSMLLAASPATTFKSVRDVIDYAKQYPDKLSNASSGNGTPGHVGFELFKYMTGTRIVHIPYKGGAAGTIDLIAGQVQLMMESSNSMTPHVKSGKVRGLAVSSPIRSPAFPDLPTIAEAGVPGYDATTWTGIVAPAGVPKAIVTKLNAEINAALATPALREKLLAIGSEPMTSTPAQFGEFIRKENVKWADVIKRSGAKVD